MLSVFLGILRTSVIATFAVVIIIIARFCLKSAPRWITCVLWGIVALRLICPVLPESNLSIVPCFESEEVYYTEETVVVNQPTQSTQLSQLYQNSQVSDDLSATYPSVNSDTLESDRSEYLSIFLYIWEVGIFLIASYGIFSYIRLRFCFRDAVLFSDNIRQSEKVTSPFVMGVLRPQIYIPFNLEKKTRKQVILHEQAHIKRFDHIWKPLGFALLCLHWFNPLMWVSYVLFCRDVEVACDEKVIKNYSLKMKKNYAMALLECRNSSGLFSATPLSFGEIGVDVRIKKTIKYKRPAVAVAVFGMVFILILSVCLLTNPVSAVTEEFSEKVTVLDNEVKNNTISDVQEVTTVPATEVPVESFSQPATVPVTELVTEPEVIPTEPIPEPYEEDNFTEDSYYEENYDNEYEYEFEYEPLIVPRPELNSTPMVRKGDNYDLLDGVVNNPYPKGVDPTKPIKIFETNNIVLGGTRYDSDEPGYVNAMERFNGTARINKILDIPYN